MIKKLPFKLTSTLQIVINVLLFCELISLFNMLLCANQMIVPWPGDFLIDIEEGKLTSTLLSSLFSVLLVIAEFAWFKGGLARIISNHIFIVIAAISFSLIITTIVFNAWMNIHISNLTQWMAIITELAPHTKAYHRFLFSVALGCFIPSLIAISWFHEKIRQDNKVLGNAKFASGLDIYRAQFFKQEDQSILIGKQLGVPLYANGFEHVLIFAPSGSGKTCSIAIPNLFHYPYSIVCNDVKFTLFETTSGYRKHVLGHECYCFAPARKGLTHRYNPLYFISECPNERITDIQRIAHILIPDTKEPIWSQSSRKLFKALVLFLLDSTDYPTTLGEINRLIKQDNFDAWLQHQLDTTNHFDPEFYRNGYSYINNHEKTRTSILETFSGYLELFDDPAIDAATSAADFDLRDLRRKKMTIYVGVSEDDLERLSPLLTLFWQQLISFMIQEIPNLNDEPYPLLCLIDEFSSLGRLERVRRSLKLLREYRVRCILMFQYIAQTYEKYSHDEAKAFTNIKTKIAYTTEDYNDAEYISKLIGMRTKRVVSYSLSNQQQGQSSSTSLSYQAVPLIRPEELMKMSLQIALIVRAGNSPVKAKQYIWYREKPMKYLKREATFIPQQLIQQKPFVRNNFDHLEMDFQSNCIE